MSETGEGIPTPPQSTEAPKQGFLSRIKESFRKDKRSEEEWQVDRIAKQEHVDKDQAEFRYTRYKQGDTYMPSKMATEVGEKYGLSNEQVKKIVEQNLSRDDAEAYGSLLHATRTLEAQNIEAHQQRMKDFETGKAIGVAPDIAADIDAIRNFDMPETPKAKALREENEQKLHAQKELEEFLTDVEETSKRQTLEQANPPNPAEYLVQEPPTTSEDTRPGEVNESISQNSEVLGGLKFDKNGNAWKVEIKIDDDLPEDKRETVSIPNGELGELKTIQRTYTTYKDDGKETERFDYFQLTDGQWYVRKPGERKLEEVSISAINIWGKTENELRNKAVAGESNEDTKPNKPIDLNTEPPVGAEDTGLVSPVEYKNAA